MTPMTMRMVPAVLTLKPLVSTDTAKRRIAPTAMRKRALP